MLCMLRGRLTCSLLLLSIPILTFGMAHGGPSCQASLQPSLGLPSWRLLRSQDEYGPCLQLPLLRHVVVTYGGHDICSNPAFPLLLNAATDTRLKIQWRTSAATHVSALLGRIGESQNGSCLQPPLLGHVVVPMLRTTLCTDPSFHLLLHTATNTPMRR